MLDRILKRLALAALVLAASLVMVPAGLALEKTAMRVTDDGKRDDWAACFATCTIQYYNICTGWVWLWAPWSDGARVGTVFRDCGDGCSLDSSFMFFRSVAPAGYGFTGTAAVYVVDANECPAGGALASQALLPVSNWNLVAWGGVAVPDNFIVSYEFAANQGLPNPMSIGSDHPAAGPTGPQACGICYPTSRTTHSYSWGTAASPVCPGSAFNDGVCNAELILDAAMSCGCGVSIDDDSWGSVKNLYR